MHTNLLKIRLPLACFVSLLAFTACNNNASTKTAESDSTGAKTEHAVATLSGTKADTTVSGTVHFEQEGNQVEMNLQISVPKKAGQSVAVHIHEHGDCGDMGKGAMGHWNPTGQQHGKWSGASFHAGDIGNINLDAKGNGSMELKTDLWSLGGSDKTNILDKAIIVHSGVDDYTSQPSGNAGERIGCGVIKKAGK